MSLSYQSLWHWFQETSCRPRSCQGEDTEPEDDFFANKVQDLKKKKRKKKRSLFNCFVFVSIPDSRAIKMCDAIFTHAFG